MSLAIKALLLIWPFLKRAIFGDRTIKEVVLANIHITVVNVCLVVVFLAFINAMIELSVVKSENISLREHLSLTCEVPKDVSLIERRKMLGDILK